MDAAWKPLGAAAPNTLSTIHHQPHQLAQWLARFARGYLPAAADDSHTNLQWREDLQILTTKDAAVESGRLAFGLAPRELKLVTLFDGAVDDAAAMHGRTDGAAGDWVRDVVRRFGLDPAALDAPAPYDMPPTPYADGAAYDAQGPADGLAELCRYFDNAALALAQAVAPYGHIAPGPSPVRVWPHHFDIAAGIALEEGDFETARSIGVGLAVPDMLSTEFYWYAYPWPNESFKALSDPGPLADFQVEGFVGGVLPMSTVVAAGDQEKTVGAFFRDGIEFLIAHLQAR